MSEREREERALRHADRIRRLRQGETSAPELVLEELDEGEDARLRTILEEGRYLPAPPPDAEALALAAVDAAYRRRAEEEGGLGRLRTWIEATRAEVVLAGAGVAVAAALVLIVVLPRSGSTPFLAGVARTPAEAEVVEWTLALAELHPPGQRGAVFLTAADAWEQGQGRGIEEGAVLGSALRDAAGRGLDPTAELRALNEADAPLGVAAAPAVVEVVAQLLESVPPEQAPALEPRALALEDQLPPAAVPSFALDMARVWARGGDPSRAKDWLTRIREASVAVDPAVLEAADALEASLGAEKPR